jgi:hypothetical protein
MTASKRFILVADASKQDSESEKWTRLVAGSGEVAVEGWRWGVVQSCMDYHMKFRMTSLAGGSPQFGKASFVRWPMSSAQTARPPCEDRQDRSGGSETPPVTQPRVRQKPEASPEVKAQVKQLQFWLKVFSRFCSDDSRESSER